MNVSEFNCLGTLKAYDFTQGDAGGVSTVLRESLQVWMKFERLGGSTNPNQAQMMSDVNARATIRYNPAITTNWVLEFEGNVYTIKFIKTDSPNYKRFMILDLSISLNQTSWS